MEKQEAFIAYLHGEMEYLKEALGNISKGHEIKDYQRLERYHEMFEKANG